MEKKKLIMDGVIAMHETIANQVSISEQEDAYAALEAKYNNVEEAVATRVDNDSNIIAFGEKMTLDKAISLIETFINMIKREPQTEEDLKELDEAIAFKNIANMPARVKCALLAWHTMEDLISKNEENNTKEGENGK